jgi:uncharacterized protein (TIGR02646 family)
MKQIKKNKELKSLVEHEKQKHADYDNYSEKDELRKALHKEQRGICCYCMGSILPAVTHMKIEHFQSQEDFPELQLKYNNLLGACKGNEGQHLKYAHCDTYKKAKVLHFHPADKNNAIENYIWYSNDGAIGSENNELSKELEEVLNLNTASLKLNRKAALDGFKDSLIKYKSALKKPTLVRWFDKFVGASHNNDLDPYCMVVAYWLQKRINRA